MRSKWLFGPSADEGKAPLPGIGGEAGSWEMGGWTELVNLQVLKGSCGPIACVYY